MTTSTLSSGFTPSATAEDPVLSDDSDWAVFDAILGTPGLTLFVLEQDGSVMATTYQNEIPNITRNASPYAVIDNVVVEESLRGTGVGKRTMAATLEAAWAVGCYKTTLLTGSKDVATHVFHRSCGFPLDTKTAYFARPPVARSTA